jgi:membrane-associated HD superfamily phosphohydrolase
MRYLLSFRYWLTSPVLLVALQGCGSSSVPPPAGPPPPVGPQLSLGNPAPETIRATRDFSVMPSSRQLDRMRHEAAARVPPIYTCDRCVEAARDAREARIKAFARGAKILDRAAKSKATTLDKHREKFSNAVGVELPAPLFDRLRRLPRAKLVHAVTKMVNEGCGDYVVADRGALEDYKGDKVILQVRARKKGKAKVRRSKRGKRGSARKKAPLKAEKKKDKEWEEIELAADKIRDVAQVKAELGRLAAVHGSGLPSRLQELLTQIAAVGVAPNLTLDEDRTRARREEAASKIKREPLTFSKGQVVLQQGEVVTGTKRRLVRLMYSVKCEPCTAGPVKCSGGLLQRLKPGGRIYRTIRATRDFQVGSGTRQQLRQGRIGASVPRFYIYDDKPRRTRLSKLQPIFEMAAAFEGRDRVKHYLRRFDKDLDAEILPQIFRKLNTAELEQVSEVVVTLYDKAQGEAIMATKPQRESEPCTIQRAPAEKGETKGKDKASARAKTHDTCPILPLAKLKVELPRRAVHYLGDTVDKLPSDARRAAIELVQLLLQANTTYDPAETMRLREKARAGARVTDRFYRKGEIVLSEGEHMTEEDRHVLQQMFSVRCMPVVFTGRRVE